MAQLKCHGMCTRGSTSQLRLLSDDHERFFILCFPSTDFDQFLVRCTVTFKFQQVCMHVCMCYGHAGASAQGQMKIHGQIPKNHETLFGNRVEYSRVDCLGKDRIVYNDCSLRMNFFRPIPTSGARSGLCRLLRKPEFVKCSCYFSSICFNFFCVSFVFPFFAAHYDCGTEGRRIGGLER